MATLKLDGYDNGFSWKITDLGNSFKTDYYIAAGITKYQFTQESSSISGIVSSVDATSDRTSKSTPTIDVENYKAGEYEFWGWCRAANGIYYPAGSDTVIVTEPSSASRPDDWEWWNTIEQGAEIKIKAKEWNSFCERINEFLSYQDMGEYDFTIVESGDLISADIVNEARTAISWLSTDIGVPSKARAGNPITASFFLDITESLNSAI